MEGTQMCVFCGRTDLVAHLGVWFVKDDRRPVHVDCWIDAYRAGRLHTARRRRTA